MNKCYNCKRTNRDGDTYCRNCGYKLQSNKHYVLVNIGTVLAFIGLLFVIVLIITSYIVN